LQGDSFTDLLASSIFAIFNYISPISDSETHDSCQLTLLHDWQTIQVQVQNHYDLARLWMSAMSEAVFLFHGYKFLIQRLKIEISDFKEESLRIDYDIQAEDTSEEDDESVTEQVVQLNTAMQHSFIVQVDGETWQRGKHASGTEIKAITWSNFRLYYDRKGQSWHVYFIVDI
jgi:SHS2 domain-containing protein